jgi:hypothetical protein
VPEHGASKTAVLFVKRGVNCEEAVKEIDCDIFDMIYLLTPTGLTPGGTVQWYSTHLHTNNKQNNTNNAKNRYNNTIN